jgi:hypothetical protein
MVGTLPEGGTLINHLPGLIGYPRLKGTLRGGHWCGDRICERLKECISMHLGAPLGGPKREVSPGPQVPPMITGGRGWQHTKDQQMVRFEEARIFEADVREHAPIQAQNVVAMRGNHHPIAVLLPGVAW